MKRGVYYPGWAQCTSLPAECNDTAAPPAADITWLAEGGESFVFRIVIPASSTQPERICVAKCFFRQRSLIAERKFADLLSGSQRKRCFSDLSLSCTVFRAAAYTRRCFGPVTQLPVDVRQQLYSKFCSAVQTRKISSLKWSGAPPRTAVPRHRYKIVRRIKAATPLSVYLHPPLLYHYYAGSLDHAVRTQSYARTLLLGQPDCPLPLQRARLVLQCLKALAAHHQAGMLHGDIKPPNILFDQAPPGAAADALPYVLVLSDYGLSQLVTGSRSCVPGCRGTPTWRAPEEYDERQPHSSWASDVYAMGSSLVDVLAGRRPEGTFEAQLDTHGCRPGSHERSLTPERMATLGSMKPALQPALLQVLKSMIHDEAAERCSLSTALQAVQTLVSSYTPAFL